MRVLIDECAPNALKVFLAKHGHESRTVQEAGWAGKQRGLAGSGCSTHSMKIDLDENLPHRCKWLGGFWLKTKRKSRPEDRFFLTTRHSSLAAMKR